METEDIKAKLPRPLISHACMVLEIRHMARWYNVEGICMYVQTSHPKHLHEAMAHRQCACTTVNTSTFGLAQCAHHQPKPAHLLAQSLPAELGYGEPHSTGSRSRV